MKMLVLLRHAKAVPTAGKGGDKSRRLAPEGVEAAAAMGAYLDRHGYFPDLALVSDSRRTRDTLDGLSSAMRVQPQVDYDSAIYEATVEDLLNCARNSGGEARCLLMVGHNPAMAELAEMLAVKGDEAQRTLLARGFPPGTVAIFQVTCDSWEALAPDCAALERFATPAIAAAEQV